MMAAKKRDRHGNSRLLGTALLVLCTTALALVGCGPPPSGASATGEALAIMVIDSTPVDVKLFVDGAYYGDASGWIERTVPLPPGARRLELRADGFYPHRRDVDLESGRSYTLHVALVPRLD